jgi:hypothetical protein
MSTSNTNHLHYGGYMGPYSTMSRMNNAPARGTTFKRERQFETIIRLENAQFTNAAIATMLGISEMRVRQIKMMPAYLAARIKITHGIIIDHEGTLATISSQRREILTAMLPPALQHIANVLQSPAIGIAAEKHKTAVALELMDREGTFAKVSRTEIKPVDKFDFEQADSASRGVIAAIKAQQTKQSTQEKMIEEAIRTSASFSRGTTLTVDEQQKALTDLEENTTLTPESLAALPIEGREQ